MPDLPDWWQGFYLVGSDITINVNIEATDVTLPISIDAATVTLDINIAAAAVTIDMNFTDQSVAVFDAAKWFAHQAQQWSVYGEASRADGEVLTISRVVPTGKTAFILGLTLGYADAAAGVNIQWWAGQAAVTFGAGSFICGGALTFDVPHRATEGQTMYLSIRNRSGATKTLVGAIWGYDEED